MKLTRVLCCEVWCMGGAISSFWLTTVMLGCSKRSGRDKDVSFFRILEWTPDIQRKS